MAKELRSKNVKVSDLSNPDEKKCPRGPTSRVARARVFYVPQKRDIFRRRREEKYRETRNQGQKEIRGKRRARRCYPGKKINKQKFERDTLWKGGWVSSSGGSRGNFRGESAPSRFVLVRNKGIDGADPRGSSERRLRPLFYFRGCLNGGNSANISRRAPRLS